LIIDDDRGLLEACTVLLEDAWDVHTVETGAAGLALLHQRDIAIILLDLRLPDGCGLEMLRQIKGLAPYTEVLILTAVSEVAVGVEAMRSGAADYIVKPFETTELQTALHQALRSRTARLPAALMSLPLPLLTGTAFFGCSPALRQVVDLIRRVADTTATVFITGESGVGKELVARALHQQSQRAPRPFVAVNCAAIPESLAASTFLGHERGAFTGAVQMHRGFFEQAQTGTLCLDEVGSLSLVGQATLLRVLQEHTFQRVGGMQTLHADVRVIATANHDLGQRVDAGLFRQDLFYRLHVVPIAVPPLRERREDIPLLLQHFLHQYNQRYQRQVLGVTVAALTVLQQYHWPGNVRELEHLVARLVAQSPRVWLAPEDIVMALDSNRTGNVSISAPSHAPDRAM
jgi:DNA-binding NtrC family response regulator